MKFIDLKVQVALSCLVLGHSMVVLMGEGQKRRLYCSHVSLLTFYWSEFKFYFQKYHGVQMLALALLCLICSAAAEEQESAVEQKVEQITPAAKDTAVAADEKTSDDKGVGFLLSLLLIPLCLHVVSLPT